MAVEGLMRRSEVYCLYALAKEASGDGVIVEIGAYRGLSTIALAKGTSQGNRVPVYSIDPHEQIDPNGREPGGLCFTSRDSVAFFKNILFAGVAEIVRPIHLMSWETAEGWNKPISLLWIDGNHGYEAVRRDFRKWEPFILRGGYLVLHDSIDPGGGPYRVVEEILVEDKFELIERVEKVTVLRKRDI
jgi:cephalosporin hydroxylase